MRRVSLRQECVSVSEDALMDANRRLIDYLNNLEDKISAAEDARLSDLPKLLNEMGVLCARAKGAALLLESKCNDKMDQTPRA